MDERTITTSGSTEWKAIEAREAEWCIIRMNIHDLILADHMHICLRSAIPPGSSIVDIARGWCVRVADPDDGIDDTLLDWSGVFADHDTAVDYMKGLLGGVHG